MTARLLAASACVVLTLLSVWVVDAESRSGAFLVRGALWGIAGVLVVWSIQHLVRRRRAARARDLERTAQ